MVRMNEQVRDTNTTYISATFPRSVVSTFLIGPVFTPHCVICACIILCVTLYPTGYLECRVLITVSHDDLPLAIHLCCSAQSYDLIVLSLLYTRGKRGADHYPLLRPLISSVAE